MSRGVRRLLAGLLLVCFALPPAALALTVTGGDFAEAMDRGLLEALGLSVATTTVSAALTLALGTPLAWWLGRSEGRLTQVLESIVRVPTVTPPAVAGVALLAAFGRMGLCGDLLDVFGIRLPFTTAAVVVAQLFVAAPYYVLPATAAFRELDEDLLWTARSLGASSERTFLRVVVPLSAPALLGGLGGVWARALGEFGATLVFAGNLPGETQTLPIAIYVTMEGDLGPARAMALVLLGLALIVFIALRSRWLERALGREPG